jgi:hypothetical protein
MRAGASPPPTYLSLLAPRAAEAERLLRSCQEQLDAAKREVVLFKRSANQAPPKQQQQPVSMSHVSQPLLNSYIGAAIRCVQFAVTCLSRPALEGAWEGGRLRAVLWLI